MVIHRYKIGQKVTFSPVGPGRSVIAGPFEVLRLLPAEGNGHQYRIRSTRDGHERVVMEVEIA